MYVLDNTGKFPILFCCALVHSNSIDFGITTFLFNVLGDFVQHYELRMGDSLTLYEDEFKNLVSFTSL